MNNSGRSMVEMLGILAIIGVLSIGALAGFNKAMMKHKLNKQAEQLNSLLMSVITHIDKLKTENVADLTNFFVKLGEVEMKTNAQGRFVDNFGQVYYITRQTISEKMHLVVFIQTDFSTSENAKEHFEMCQNLFKVVQNYSPYIHYFDEYSYNQDGQGNRTKAFPGDAFCKTKCLNNADLDSIYDFCTIQSGQKNGHFKIWFMF